MTSVPCPSAPLHSPHFFGLDVDLDLHAGIAVPRDAPDEISGPDGGKRNNIVTGRESRYGARAVARVVPCLAHLHHVVHIGGVLELELIAGGEPDSGNPLGVVGLRSHEPSGAPTVWLAPSAVPSMAMATVIRIRALVPMD
ncbi:hypothetical protein TRIUR3_00290 [Triticum urartu]|uniref:Uncharacterized protein n=1 Tax=Triticum urartu TaxID=4572 RepID=M7Z9H4_TRIUA|nr:hypothetical protein TRIUR3_00290 [Triticum urartu]